jgi:hypothetical protein
MSHSPTRRKQAEFLAERRRRREAARQAVIDRAAAQLRPIIPIWNAQAAGGELWFYPTIGGAVIAGFPFLDFYCPGCLQCGTVDLRQIDRHPSASLQSLIPALSCRRCTPNPPFAQLAGLRQPPPLVWPPPGQAPL